VTLDETPPTLHACPRCRAVVLRCLCEGLDTETDTTPLTIAGQIAALETGRNLYQIEIPRYAGRKGAYLIPRDENRIRSSKPHVALAEHKCGEPLKEHVDEAAQSTLNEWLYPAHPKTVAHIPPF
jgi:hypothetical protein